MKKAKACLALLLSLLLVLCALPSSFAASLDTVQIPENEVTGKCGSYASYNLNLTSGLLRIYRSGGAKSAKMNDFADGGSPFYGNLGIKTVEIEPWILNIGSEAFAGCENIEHVSIPFTVKEIGANAFDGCDSAVFLFDGTSTGWEDVKIADGNDWKDDPDRVQFTTSSLYYADATFPTPEAGDTVQLNAPLPVFDAEQYSAELNAVYYENGGANVYLKNGDVYRAGMTYTFEIVFAPMDGYAFEEDTIFTVNGDEQNAPFHVATFDLTIEEPQPDDKSGTLKMLAYNVSGIPLIGGFQGSTFTFTNDRAAKIGALLNTTDVDFISVEEDFNGHNALAAKMTNYPYRSFTSGGLAQGQGLNVFSPHKIYNIDRVKWNWEYGTVSGSCDALSNKGFLYSLMELAPGVYINVITVHCDAGYDALSIKARSTNFKQLAEYINNNLNDGRALIVQGDFNFKFKRNLADDLVGNLMEPTGLKDVWLELFGGGVSDPDDPLFRYDPYGDELDRVLYRSGDSLTLEPVSKTVPPLTGPNGERYTDHNPMLTEFRYTLTGEPEDVPQNLTEPTAEDEAMLTFKEVLWTVVRIFQAVLGLLELPYLIGQGVDLLINGKMA